jgi:hypothetical protein
MNVSFVRAYTVPRTLPTVPSVRLALLAGDRWSRLGRRALSRASGRVGDSVVGVGAVEAVALSRSVVFGQAEAEVSA